MFRLPTEGGQPRAIPPFLVGKPEDEGEKGRVVKTHGWGFWAKWRRLGVREVVEEQFDLQGGRCFWCSVVLPPDWEVDHIIPVVRGGQTEDGNLVCCCTECNDQKGGRVPFIEWEPRKPLQEAGEIAILRAWLSRPD
jgi:5-methylcytosine-specific restriction endonuclease McrA